jgi:signal transduction histidine kinase
MGFSMDLRLSLILRIALVALLCLCAASGYVLFQSDRASTQGAMEMANLVGKQIEFQLIRLDTGTDDPARFPDWDALLESPHLVGLCVRYVQSSGKLARSNCYREGSREQIAPGWFAGPYRWAFAPGREVVRRVSFRGLDRGAVIVAPDPDSEVSRAWRDVQDLVGLTVITVLALSTLIYVVVSRALKPTQHIVSILRRLERGDRTARLPRFDLREFHSIGEGVNRLTDSLDESLAERLALYQRLIHVQEEERRHLARDLHDEFGQCLAAISAAAASVQQTAREHCRELMAEGERISRIVEHMMAQVRGMLLRLRPPGIDELGLIGSLHGLIDGWNARSAGGTRFDLHVSGDLGGLPDSVNVNLFRIVQECITNAAKHANATEVTVRLERSPGSHGSRNTTDIVELAVEDNGTTRGLSVTSGSGMGVLGIRERIAELGGTVDFDSSSTGGAVVHARLPLPQAAESETEP